MNKASQSRHNRRLVTTCAAIALLWSAVGVGTYSTAVQVDDTAISFPLLSRLKPVFRTVLTQGWAFFTRSPRERDFYLLGRHDEGAWQNASRGPAGRADSFFGLARVARAEGVDIGVITSSLPGSAWTECLEPMDTCFEDLEAHSAHNPSHSPLVCGEVGIALAEPSPWAWQRVARPFVMPSLVVRLNVEC